ncbi:MAG TPA: fumarylacetoacetate hydrolase family protein [Steroidobacteraceae bacterium]|nr:fumarylacetoacetate hydrolase family protein [Steroidobacteraceae bacterium]
MSNKTAVNAELGAFATELINAYDTATMLAPLTKRDRAFDVTAAYAVRGEIDARRRAQGWRSAGRKIGFTNRTLWPRYDIWDPLWAHMWAHTVRFAGAAATLQLESMVQPRIEPEVVFRLKSPVPPAADALQALDCIEWVAPGFEIVQSHFPDWKFAAPDCTAAFGLHAALLVGTPVAITDANRRTLAEALPQFALTLSRGREVIDRGTGSDVLDSPVLALVHLARVLASQPQFAPLAAGEIITTGSLTDAWPVRRGETWSSDYGTLGIGGLTATFS